MAAKPVTVTGSLSQPILHYDKDGDGVISFGDSIKFEAETNVTGNDPLVEINLNFTAADGTFLGGWWGKSGQDAGLYSPLWHEGPAHGQADLGYFDRRSRFHIIDTVTFEVAA